MLKSPRGTLPDPPSPPEPRRPYVPPPPEKKGPEFRVVAGGAAAVLILAIGAYALANSSSDGETDSSVNQGSSNRAQISEAGRDSGSQDALPEADATGDSALEQGEGVPVDDQTPEPESVETLNESQTRPSGSVSGYIAQLGSFTERAGAEKRLGRLESRGLVVGILRSGDYPQMTPGYWVVYSGPFDSKALADSAAESSGIQDAFPREISPG